MMNMIILPGRDKMLGQFSRIARLFLVLLSAVIALTLSLTFFGAARAAGVLQVEILAAYNLVVDSNVSSPSTYAPSVATVAGEFCNTGDETLTNVQGYIGNYIDGSNDTPGEYPLRNSATFDPGDPLYNTGTYAFTHIGGRLGTTDAIRFLGDLAPGECKVEYWHFTYPQCSGSETPPCSGIPVWGDSVKPEDDLWLDFDIWGTADDGATIITADTSRKMTMRNEISALANKIEPNPNGRWFNTKNDTVRPGEVITSNGILYELGNVRFGFDNDNDYVPDFNAWVQPIGDANYDPGCFRLVRTSGVLTVTRGSGNPDMIVPFQDQLYFTDLPPDNTGVTGNVYYTFLALDGPCSTALSPYQEVASGYDNEKFNGDYGTGIPPVESLEPLVTIDKSSNPTIIPLGSTTTYRIPFANTGDSDAGLGLSTGGSTPVVISDTIPDGMQFVTATWHLDYAPNNGVTTRYSSDSGGTWNEGYPAADTTSTAPNNLVIIQWWLNDALPAYSTGNYAEFEARVPGTYTGSPFIENCAEASFGTGLPFAEACAIIMIEGTKGIGDFVWQDEDGDGLQDGGVEVGIDNITVSLYWDRDGDGRLDSNDPLITTTLTTSGGDYLFDRLPHGDFLVQVDSNDSDLPAGYGPTTAEMFPVTGLGTIIPGPYYLEADFGFGPVLRLDKKLVSGDPAYEGQQLTYTIDLVNTRPGDGTGEPTACSYNVWATVEDPEHEGNNNQWVNPSNAFGAMEPDGLFAYSAFANNLDQIAGTGYNIGPQAGRIVSVEAIWQLYSEGTWVNDNAEAHVYFNGIEIASRTATGGNPITTAELVAMGPGIGGLGILSWDVTAARSWTWADFVGDLDLELDATRRQGGDGGSLYMDAMGFRITTSEVCGGPEDTIDPLPLTDTYDADLLEFVSASPAATSVITRGVFPYANTGTISWANLGPLYAGQSRVITVTFTALEPPDNDGDGENDSTTITNCVSSTGATFIGGAPVNSATACVTGTLNPTGSIGDTIWNDNGGPSGTGTAGDGVQNGDEAGIPNVTVWLYTDPNGDTDPADGVITATQVTDADGYYLFTGLLDGDYVVVVDTSSLPGSTFTQTGDPDEPSPPACTTCDSRGSTTINNNDGDPNNDDDLTQDFGYRISNAIYGNVWEDNDGDGVWETGENGFSGVTVNLMDCGGDTICGTADDVITGTTTTDLTGGYVFTDLLDGNYQVIVVTSTLPAGATWTQTADPDATLDDLTDVLNVSGGNVYGAYDFGYHREGIYSLGDTLYVDWDGDGVQDLGSGTGLEEGIPNVTILLYQDDNGDGVIDPATDGLIMTTTTDADGIYTFANLAAQSYIVVVDESDPDFPAGHAQTQDPDEGGVCSTCDGQGSATLGPDDYSVDFGYHPLGAASIGDFVWRDDDGDGIQDAGEPGIADITVGLYEDSNNDGVIDGGDALVMTTSTNLTGTYLFIGLPAGDYLVLVDSADPQLPVDGNGDPYVLSTDNPHDVALAVGEQYLAADFGFTIGGVIGDYVWQDNDGDGGQDLGEPGIDGVAVTLYDCGAGTCSDGDETVVDTAVTDSSGLYEFTGLPAANYRVEIDSSNFNSGNPLYNFAQTGDPDESPPCTDCDSLSDLSLAPGQIDRSRDFGYQPPGTLGDFVWMDMNGDGVQDPGEAGIGGVVITLTLQGGTVYTTTTTDSDGYYSFGNLPGGTHTVAVALSTLPSGLTATYDYDGGLDSQASVVLPAGGSNYDIDFGYRSAVANTISGTVFHDDNDDAVQAVTETVTYEGVTLYLWNCGADNVCGSGDDDFFVASAATDTNGDYVFTNLPDGRYLVSVNPDAPNLTGTFPTVTSSPTTYRQVDLDQGGTNPAAVSVTDQDFGFLSRVDMGDLPEAYAITDLNDDGARHIVPVNPAERLILGSDVNIEPDGKENASADLDEYDDGVERTPLVFWNAGPNGGSVDVTVNGCDGTCYVSAWIDWANNNNFHESWDRVLLDYPVSDGMQTITFNTPPTTTFGTTFNVRFRLYESSTGGWAQPTGMTDNGEVEDYQWLFGPTAISLQNFDAHSDRVPSAFVWLLLFGAMTLLGIGALLLGRRRRVRVRSRRD